MAQAGYTPISLYYSTTAAAVPVNTNLASGELAINITDGKLYYKDNTGTVKLIASNASTVGVDSISFGSTGLTPSTATTGVVTVAGTLNVANGGTGLTTLTAGYIPFGAGTSAFGSNSSLFWDSANARLGVGTNAPVGRLMIYGSSNVIQTNVGSSAALTSYPLLAKNAVMTLVGDSANNENYPGSLGILTTGVGTSTRGANLYLNSTRSTNAQLNSSTFTALNANDTLGTVLFGGDNSVNLRTVGAAVSANAGTTWSATNAETFLTFSTTPQNSTNVTERVRIDSNGYVGILTTLQNGTRLNVMGGNIVPATSGSTQTGGLRVSSLDTGTGGYVLDTGVSNTNGYAWMQVSNSANLASGFTKPLVLQPVGENVGIGNTAPANKLTIAVAGNATLNTPAAHAAVFNSNDAVNNQYYGLAFTNSNSPEGGVQKPQALISCFAAGGSWSSNWAGDLVFATASGGSNAAPTEKFRIASAGQLGIGGANYGTAGQVLTSGGPSAPPTWSTGGGGSTSPGGSNTQVQFNSSGSFGGSANFTFNGSGITTGFVNVNASTPPTAGMYYQSTATSGLSFYNTGALGGNSAVQIYYGRSSLAATTGGIDNSPVQWYGFGSGQTPQLTIGSTASIYYFQGHGYRLDSVPYVFTIRGGSRGDNGSYTVPESNGILYIDVGADYGGNGSTGRNCIYVKNDATGFGTSTNGVKVVNNFYGRQNAFYSLQKIGDPNGGGQNFGFYAQIDTSNGANDNAAPVGLVIDNALVDNYTKSNGNAQMAIFYDRRSGSTTRTAIQFYRNTTGNSVGLITTTNSATAYTTSSDYRLKENIAPLTGAIEKVLRLKPSTYTWKIDGSVGEGFIAHELQEVIPQAVSGDKDAEKLQQVEVEHAVSEVQDADGNIVSYGKAPVYEEKMMPVYQGVDTSFLVATLTAAIQEQQALIVALTARVEALEAK